jgi:predicted transcriptional regulator
MATITLRVSDEEKDVMSNFAKFNGTTLSNAIKQIFFERLEDEYDLKAIEAYEKEKAAGKVVTFSLDEVISELGLSDELSS